MADEKIAPMREEFPRWYRVVAMGDNRERLEARWKGVIDLVENADQKRVESMISLALRTKPRPPEANVASLRQSFKKADDLFDMQDNDREMEILCGTALATLIGSQGEQAALAALLITTASCAGTRVSELPFDLVGTAETAIIRISDIFRARPDISSTSIAKAPQVGLSQEIANMKQSLNGETAEVVITTLSKQINNGLLQLARSSNSSLGTLRKFVAIQDEELQMLWWLFGGRSKKMDRPFADLPHDAQPFVLASELAEATEFLPGPPSVKPILSRAGLKEGKKLSVPAAVNACDTGLLRALVDNFEPSQITQPLHFAIKRKLETGDETSWVAAWSTITGIDADFALPGIELGNLFYRERLTIELRGEGI